MTVSALTQLFLMNMGYAHADTAEPDVVEEYSGVLLQWLNEGYVRAVRRTMGTEAIRHMDLLKCEEDEPVKLDVMLHPLLADYAAARGQELRGNVAAAGGLYTAFERGLAEVAGSKLDNNYRAWRRM